MRIWVTSLRLVFSDASGGAFPPPARRKLQNVRHDEHSRGFCLSGGFGVSQIRVHELAGQLGVSPQDVLSSLRAEGRKVRGPSAVLAASVAAHVRRSFRRTNESGPGSRVDESHPERIGRVPSGIAGHAPFALSDGADDAAGLPFRAATPEKNEQLTVSAANPFLEPGAAATAVTPLPPAAPVFGPPARVRTATVPAQRSAPPQVPVLSPAAPPDDPADLDQEWRDRGISELEQSVWVEAGLHPGESSLADRCLTADIAPADLKTRLSGRTTVQRLRDGESVTSVWARIQEAGQQQPRIGTRLTGRFRQR